MFSNFGPGLLHLCCPCATIKPDSAFMATSLSMNEDWAHRCLCCFPAACARRVPQHPDIAYQSFEGRYDNFSPRLFQSPFVVTIDRTTRSVVIGIRGTMSTGDLLVDLLIKEQTIRWKDESGNQHDAKTRT
jgi:hypothetical protein